MHRSVVEKLLKEEDVISRSDWGVDTMYTFYSVKYGYPMLETYISEGKLHKLYGKLTDLKTMLVECFDTIQSLKDKSFSLTSKKILIWRIYLCVMEVLFIGQNIPMMSLLMCLKKNRI